MTNEQKIEQINKIESFAKMINWGRVKLTTVKFDRMVQILYMRSLNMPNLSIAKCWDA
jgi:biotin synthase-related radical SAM superfamily protein